MRRLSIILIVAAAGVAVVMMLVPAMVSSRLAKMEIADRISAWTGQPTTLRGDPVVTMFPPIGVEVNDVLVAGKDGDRSGLRVAIPSVKASLNMLSLLAGRVDVETLTLTNPRIRLPSGAAGGPEARPADFGAALSGAGDVRLDGIILRDGAITYGPRGETLEAVNLHLAWRHETGRVELSGSFEWRGRRVEVDAELDDLPAVFDGRGSDGRVRLAAVRTKAAAPPDPANAAGESPSGDTDGAQQPLRDLVKSLGEQVGGGSTLGPLVIAGRLEVGETSLKLLNATLELDGNTGDADFMVRRSGQRPWVRGSLSFEELDLDPYATSSLETTLVDLLAVPLSSTWFSRIDVDVSASAGEVVLEGNELTEAFATLRMHDRRVTFVLAGARLGDGHMQGDITLDAAGEGIAASLAACFNAVPVADAVRFARALPAPPIGLGEPIEGTGTAGLELAGRGGTLGDIIESSSGALVLDIQDGAVGGIDLESTLERLADGNTVIAGGKAPFIPVTGRTPFESLTALAVVEAGAVRTGRIRVDGERYRVVLSGGGDLSQGELDGQGVASLLRPEFADKQDQLPPIVELPFGVGGTVRQPMLVPGIPRVGHGPHAKAEVSAAQTRRFHPDGVDAPAGLPRSPAMVDRPGAYGRGRCGSGDNT